MPLKNSTDIELVEAIGRKDREAFDEFYGRYSRLLYQWAYNRTHSVELSDEITQNFWLSFWLEPNVIKADGKGCVNRFLLHHFTFKMLDFLKSSYVKTLQGKYRVDFEELENELIGTNLPENFDVKDFLELVNEILDDMPHQIGEVFKLIHCEGYTFREAAEKLDCNERTVKYKSKEGVALLKKALKQRGIDPDYLYLFIAIASIL